MLVRLLSLLLGIGAAAVLVAEFPGGSVISMLTLGLTAAIFLGYGLLGAKFDQRLGLGLEKPTTMREIASSAVEDSPVASAGIAMVGAVKQKRQAAPESGAQEDERP